MHMKPDPQIPASGRLLQWLLVCSLLAGMPLQLRADPGPVELMQTVTAGVLEVIRRDPAILGDPLRMRSIANELILPHVDFETLSRWVLGKHWRQATQDQRKRFIELFRERLLSSYLRSVTGYRDNTVRFLPLRAGQPDGRALVDAEISQPSGPLIHAEFRMHRVHDRWLIYDVAVEGISLVATHRSSFSREISSNGIAGLLSRLEEMNDAGGGEDAKGGVKSEK
jgi:phospholipid transport system substrate-binding protein